MACESKKYSQENQYIPIDFDGTNTDARWQVVGEIEEGENESENIVSRNFVAYDRKENMTVYCKGEHQWRFFMNPDGVKRMILTNAVVSHPNVAEVYNWINIGEWEYVFMEYLDPSEWKPVYSVDTRDWSVGQILHYVHELAETVDELVQKGVEHNDIGHHNLYISNDFQRIKLIDFGCAQFSDSSKAAKVYQKAWKPRGRDYSRDITSIITEFHVLMCKKHTSHRTAVEMHEHLEEKVSHGNGRIYELIVDELISRGLLPTQD